ncbi:MAG: hypothetical protein SFU53_15795 [Terrimicrobiaceae bacterium]|nr:hypothetical protein [Terrimicrobiaceae bacterium]
MKVPSIRHSRGSVLVFALFVILVATFVLAAWVQSLATQVDFNESFVDGQKRRIAEANGRALLRQHVLTGMATGTVPAVTFALSNDWGGFSVPNASGTLATTNVTFSRNPFSPAASTGFQTNVTASIHRVEVDVDGNTVTNALAWSVRVRSRSPLYAGYPLTVQSIASASPAVTGVALDSGRLLTWPTNSAIAPTAASYQARGSAASSNPGTILGFPWVPLTSGALSGTNAFGGGYSLTPALFNEVTDDPATTADGIVRSDSGSVRTLSVDLGTVVVRDFAGSISNALIHLRLTSPTAAGINELRVILTGTASSFLPAVHLIHEEAPGQLNLTQISLVGENSRRVYLSVEKSSALAIVATEADALWRLSASIAGAPVSVDPNVSLTIEGGIRTSGELTVAAGETLEVGLDDEPESLELMADRLFWLEENRAP